jgi:hypothetical protein
MKKEFGNGHHIKKRNQTLLLFLSLWFMESLQFSYCMPGTMVEINLHRKKGQIGEGPI